MSDAVLARRPLLAALAAGLLTAPGRGGAVGGAASEAEPIRLRAAPARVSLVGEGWPTTEVWAYEGRVPGPVLRARQGEVLRLELENGLSEPTSLHFHGLRLPPGPDGLPPGIGAEVPPGGKARFALPLEEAGTFWYHPFRRAAAQVARGLYGLLVVEEPSPYPVDRELPLVLDDWRLGKDAVNQPRAAPQEAGQGGAVGEVVTVEGRVAARFELHTGERLRLRLLNAATARIFALRFKGADPWLLALDGRAVLPGELPRPFLLAPGMRADLLLEVPAVRLARIDLLDDAEPQGAVRLASFWVVRNEPPRPARSLEPPPPLPPPPLAEPDLDRAERHELVIDGGVAVLATGRPPVLDPPAALPPPEPAALRRLAARGLWWTIQGRALREEELPAAPPLLRLARGRSHRLELMARTAVPVALHLHGHAFRVLARDGRPEPGTPWRDTVLLRAGERVAIALRTERAGRFPLHGTVLDHMAAGMLGLVEVV